MKIPVLSGIFLDNKGNYRVQYPVNMTPVVKPTGINDGYIRPAEGVLQFAQLSAPCRGTINWNGTLYVVYGDKLARVDVDGNVTNIGSVNSGSHVTMTYSFDRLAIATGNRMWYYDGTSLTPVTDPDLGAVLDVVWIDGYFITTDGEFIVVTELNNPFSVDPLKYGSSEAEPDPVVGLAKVNNELFALNRYSIEVFNNIGGDGFPFQRNDGSMVQRGAISTHAKAVLNDILFFVGGGRNESIGLFATKGGNSEKVSTDEIDRILNENDLSEIYVESRIYLSHQFIYIHLSEQTLVFDYGASQIVGMSVWHILKCENQLLYRAKYFCQVYSQWISADVQKNKLGTMTEATPTLYGDPVNWEINTMILWNSGRTTILHEIELVGLPSQFSDGYMDMTYSRGVTWSNPRRMPVPKIGDYKTRMRWLRCGMIRDWLIFRFSGDSKGAMTINTINARVEGEQ